MAAYYNDVEPFVCEWLRRLIAAGEIPPGDVDDRNYCTLTKTVSRHRIHLDNAPPRARNRHLYGDARP